MNWCYRKKIQVSACVWFSSCDLAIRQRTWHTGVSKICASQSLYRSAVKSHLNEHFFPGICWVPENERILTSAWIINGGKKCCFFMWWSGLSSSVMYILMSLGWEFYFFSFRKRPWFFFFFPGETSDGIIAFFKDHL